MRAPGSGKFRAPNNAQALSARVTALKRSRSARRSSLRSVVLASRLADARHSALQLGSQAAREETAALTLEKYLFPLNGEEPVQKRPDAARTQPAPLPLVAMVLYRFLLSAMQRRSALESDLSLTVGGFSNSSKPARWHWLAIQPPLGLDLT